MDMIQQSLKSYGLKLILISVLISSLTACGPAVVGGVVVGTSVVLDERTLGNLVEDQNIKAKFLGLYSQDDRFNDQHHVNIASYNLQVLLTGEVPNEQDKAYLEEMVRRIKNVRHVFNELQIAGPTTLASQTQDTYITSKIKTSVFSQYKELQGAQVKVVTEDRAVFLMGLVTPQQGNQITEIARKTSGVKKVVKLFEYPPPNDNRI